MTWVPIVCIVLYVLWAAFTIGKDFRDASNKLPYGKRAVQDFVKKVDRICDANRITKGNLLPNKSGIVLPTRVVEHDTGKGLEYETIPMYKCKSVYINDEEVARVHCVHNYFKDNYFLEFTSSRKLDEISDIVNAAYNIAQPIYKEHWDKLGKTQVKSFYDVDERGERE